MKPIMAGVFNMSDIIVSDEEIENHPVTKREKRKKRALPAVNEIWEKDVGLTTPGDQAACGSCWSFPNVSFSYRGPSGSAISVCLTLVLLSDSLPDAILFVRLLLVCPLSICNMTLIPACCGCRPSDRHVTYNVYHQ